MTFNQLLAVVSVSAEKPAICTDSRRIKKGDCFVAVPGTKFDGHDFVGQALENGAEYIVCQRPVNCPADRMIVVQDTTVALAQLAQAYYGSPSASLTNLAVTGTNGKTTVSFLVRSVIQSAGHGCGLVGTIVYDTGDTVAQSSLTTPDALYMARLAAEMVANGAGFTVIEASSHALGQNRLAAIDFTAAAFTNLTGDHLDYHKTMDEYLAAKLRLFTSLPAHGIAVLNAQSPDARRIADAIKNRILWYSIGHKADITAHIHSMDTDGSVFSIEFNNYMEKVRTPLAGRHNISNHLAAAGLCLAAGFDLTTVTKGLSALQTVPGRLEAVNCGQDFTVLVDYAHTDDAIKNVLDTLRPLCLGKLIVVFGCGGDRDKTKRPRMASVAEKLADMVLVTSDNPRTEQPEQIIRDITAGFASPDSRKIHVEPDRRKAIELAIKIAQSGDIVLIAGKGHETYQIIGTEKFDFDDRAVARQYLERIL